MVRAVNTVFVVAAAVCWLFGAHTGGDGVRCTVFEGRVPSTGAQVVAVTAITHTQTRVYTRRNAQA